MLAQILSSSKTDLDWAVNVVVVRAPCVDDDGRMKPILPVVLHPIFVLLLWNKYLIFMKKMWTLGACKIAESGPNGRADEACFG